MKVLIDFYNRSPVLINGVTSITKDEKITKFVWRDLARVTRTCAYIVGNDSIRKVIVDK